jgi:hypothetical protein
MSQSITIEGAGAASNARLRLIAAILVGVIGPEVFIVQPGFVQGLVQNLGFDDQSAGYAASIEVWGITATTLLYHRTDDRGGRRIDTARKSGGARRLLQQLEAAVTLEEHSA